MVVWNDLVADEKLRIYDKGVEYHQPGRRIRPAGALSVRRYVGSSGGTRRGTARELSYFVDCISSGKDPFNDGRSGLRVVKMLEAASESLEDERIDGLSMNSYNSSQATSNLGRNVRLSKFINLYGCEIGDETKIGAFVEIQKNASVGKRCKISSHSFICEGVDD
jgi:NDP-sugar pyrophosphorylase family protein